MIAPPLGSGCATPLVGLEAATAAIERTGLVAGVGGGRATLALEVASSSTSWRRRPLPALDVLERVVAAAFTREVERSPTHRSTRRFRIVSKLVERRRSNERSSESDDRGSRVTCVVAYCTSSIGARTLETARI